MVHEYLNALCKIFSFSAACTIVHAAEKLKNLQRTFRYFFEPIPVCGTKIYFKRLK